MSTRKMLFICGVVLTLCLGVAFPSGSYTVGRPDDLDDAERLADRFISESKDLKRLNKDELTRLVGAICEGEEEERRSVARDALDRVKSQVISQSDRLNAMGNEILVKLKKVIDDDRYKDKKSRAEDYKKRVEETLSSVERMTVSLRGSNHPVVSYMLDKGNEVHKEYQSSSSRCTVTEWTIGSLRADCIYAYSCEVIELKPYNSRSISRGRDQVRDYVQAVNRPDELARLQKENSSFAHCKQFTPKIRCYTLCPDISDDGEVRSTYADWRDCGP